MWRAAFYIALAVACFAYASEDIHPLSDEYINRINSVQSLWKAGRNFDPDTPWSYITSLMGAMRHSKEGFRQVEHVQDPNTDIPESFDAREQWSHCPSLKVIADQSACGSCWAVATASCMSDRICIKSNGQNQTTVSSINIVSCCQKCGFGCFGGYPIKAWNYWETDGIVTGGSYNSSVGCKPYPFPPCNHELDVKTKEPSCLSFDFVGPHCVKTCNTSSLIYEKELTYGHTGYSLKDEKNIQLEIQKNGPAVAIFDLYEDFLSYKSGVYQNTTSRTLGRHAVRILGWGVENHTKYWLISNSWNEDWGDNGYFKIIRGENNCGIEEDVSAGLPKL